MTTLYIKPAVREACRYVRDGGGIVTVESFDKAHDPVGHRIRHDCMPHLFYADRLHPTAYLLLTDAGRAIADNDGDLEVIEVPDDSQASGGSEHE